MNLSQLDKLDTDLDGRLREARDRSAVRRRLERDREALAAKLAGIERQIRVNDAAKVVLQAIEVTQQAELKEKLEKLVTFALTAIFERDLKFRVEFDVRGQQTEASFKILDERGNLMPVKDAHGGGLLVVAAFLLRTIVMLSSRPALAPLIVHDEPFVHVSDEYRERLTDFLRQLARSAGVQMILVTHLPELASVGDRRYRFSLRNGRTVAEEI